MWRVQIQGRRLAFAFGELEILCSFIGAMVVDTGIVLGKLPTAGESSELWRNSVLWSQARDPTPLPACMMRLSLTPCLYDEASSH